MNDDELRVVEPRGEKPRFKVGDLVISFRGERAKITEVFESHNWRGKSHKVCVEWLDKPNKVTVEYNEEVFEPYPYGDDPVMEMETE